MEEEWRLIPEFPDYEISNFGVIYNRRTQAEMRTSLNNFGHPKIGLVDEEKVRYTRSVALLVAQVFVIAPSILCDTVIHLDGDPQNVRADNLAWRPSGFAWRYRRQLHKRQPLHYQNLKIIDLMTGEIWPSVIELGMAEGLLFDDIWRSTYMGTEVYPHRHIYEVDDRV